MRMRKSHYTNYLISIHFDYSNLPSNIAGLMSQCEYALEDIGNLALKSGHRLHSTYSVVQGLDGYHAHFGLSWLPLLKKRIRNDVGIKQDIVRMPIIDILEENNFVVDNPKQAIKAVTRRKEYVTRYVVLQPKENQNVLDSGFYVHQEFEPVHSSENLEFYCPERYLTHNKKHTKNRYLNIIKKLILMSAANLTLISLILLSLF